MANLSTFVVASGNLTKDPEVRMTTSGTTIVKVTVASNPRTFNKDKNEWEDDEPIFWEGKAFGAFADRIVSSFKKGDRVIIVGPGKTESWTDKDSGTKRSKTVVMLDDMGLSPFWNEIQRGAPAQTPAQADAWNTPGSFGDDTPF